MILNVSRVQRLVIVLMLNIGLVAALVVVGLTAQSLGVFAMGVDCLADAAAVGVSLLAIWLASRHHGFRHATNVAALVNSGWMFILCVVLAVAAVWHLAAGARRVEGLPVLIVSAVTAVVLLAGALVLGADEDGNGNGNGNGDGRDDAEAGPGREGEPGREDLNFKAVLLDTAGDSAASAGVAVSGGIIFATGGLYWLDPATALVISAVVGYHAARLLAKAAAALRGQ